MHRAFEELGVTVGGIAYAHFTGEAQFDDSGQPVIIDLETARFIALRRKLGVGFLEDGGFEVREHLKKWVLFQGLSESLMYTFREDIEDYLAELKSDRGARWDAA